MVNPNPGADHAAVLDDPGAFVHHRKIGASWEGCAIEEAIKAIAPEECYFWGTHNGAELDLLVLKDGKRIGIECKRVDAPRITRSRLLAPVCDPQARQIRRGCGRFVWLDITRGPPGRSVHRWNFHHSGRPKLRLKWLHEWIDRSH